MFRPAMYTPPHRPLIRNHRPWPETRAHLLLLPLTLWLCVSLSLRYGFYRDCRMVVGPSSSRLMVASSLFVRRVEVSDDSSKQQGVLLYGFSEKPELTHQTNNWSVSNFLIVGSYSRKGFSLWLNKGSRIHIRLETQDRKLNQTQLVIIKGERKLQAWLPKLTSTSDPHINRKDANYTVEEDDRYYFGIINMNPRSIIMTVSVNVSSKMHDLTKAKTVCSTLEGSCRLKLLFPHTQYVILTTPQNGDLDGWYIELSLVARMITYVAILVFLTAIVFLVLKYLGACTGDSYNIANTTAAAAREASETDPLVVPQKPVQFTYGTMNQEEDDAGSCSSSSEDLYDAKLCVICYDDQRNCFFVPCGHCATCYNCAQRIMVEESKMCPICRRLIHKVRRLFTP